MAATSYPHRSTGHGQGQPWGQLVASSLRHGHGARVGAMARPGPQAAGTWK